MPHAEQESPSHAEIVARISSVESKLTAALDGVAAELRKQRETKGELVRYLFGGPNGPGIAELVRQHERWISTQRKIFLVLVPAVVLGIGAVVWEAIVSTIRAQVP